VRPGGLLKAHVSLSPILIAFRMGAR
jgi:hypothetical protein